MPVAFQNMDTFIGHLGGGRIDLDSDTFNAVLTNVVPSNSPQDEDLVDLTQIANGNGYLTGGIALTGIAWTEPTEGKWRFTSNLFEWEASGGAIGPFRYVAIYSDTSVDDKIVGWYDFQSELTIPDGSFFRVTPGANGIVQFGVGTIA